MGDGLPDKLKLLINNDQLFSLLLDNVNAFVCQNCFNRVEQTYGFITQLRNSAKQFIDGTTLQVKRGSASPAHQRHLLFILLRNFLDFNNFTVI